MRTVGPLSESQPIMLSDGLSSGYDQTTAVSVLTFMLSLDGRGH